MTSACQAFPPHSFLLPSSLLPHSLSWLPRIRERRGQYIRRSIMLISVGWLPPLLCPSGACPLTFVEGPCGLNLSPRVTPLTGAAPLSDPWIFTAACPSLLANLGQRDLLGDGPHEGNQFTRDGRNHQVAMLAPRQQSLAALAQSNLGLPGNRANLLGQLLLAHLNLTGNARRMAVGPRGLHVRPPCMGVAGLGDAPLTSSVPAGVLAGPPPNGEIGINPLCGSDLQRPTRDKAGVSLH